MNATIKANENQVSETFNSLFKAGFNCLPIGTEKKPLVPSWGEWQRTKQDKTTIEGFIKKNPKAFAIITGSISENLEAIDFDLIDFYEGFIKLCKDTGAGELIDRIVNGYCESTPTGGRHLLYKLAGNEPVTGAEQWAFKLLPETKHTIAIETRGQGGYIVIAPSEAINKHTKKMGKYELIAGSIETIVTITKEERNKLKAIASSLCEKNENKQVGYQFPPAKFTGNTKGILKVKDSKPIETFNLETPWESLLVPDGWNFVEQKERKTYWHYKNSENKVSGWSGGNASDSFCAFTSNAPSFITPNKSYSKFNYIMARDHGGDFQSTLAAIRGEAKPIPNNHDASSWPALPAKQETIEPFPLDIFPKKLQKYIAIVAKAIACPIDFVAVSVLIASAVAIGGKRSLQVKDGWQENTVLWIGLIGESGEGKSPAIKAALAPLRKRVKENAERYRLAYAQYKEDLKAAKQDSTKDTPKEPIRESLVVNNTTLEALRLAVERSKAGILLASDELAGWLKSMSAYNKGPDRECWLSLWSSLDEESHRKTSGVTYLENPIVNLIGGIQPDIVSFLHGGTDDGLLARFLLVKPAKVLGKFALKGIPPEAAQDYEEFIEELLNLEPQSRNASGKVTPRIINLSEDALKLLQGYSDGLKQDNFTDAVPTILKGTFSKADGYACRIALTLHEAQKALEGECAIEVSKETMAKAIKLMNYFLATALRLAPEFNEGFSKEELVKQSILSWITRHKKTLRENQACFNWTKVRHDLRQSKGIRNASGKVDDIRLEDVLVGLCVDGYLKRQDVFDDAGKTLKPDFLINPRLLD